MGFFATDFKIQVCKILAPALRSTTVQDFLRGTTGGALNVSAALWNTFDANIRAQASANGQKIVLQNTLNTLLSVAGIYIVTNQSLVSYIYFYEPAEGIPDYFYEVSENDPEYFFELSEVPAIYNYTIFIPVGVYTAELNRRVIAYTKLFALAGKLFNTATY